MRTNAFMMRRDILISLGFKLEDAKLDCLEFESGPSSLQARLEQRDLQAVLVGADGRTFGVEHWPESGTFRLGDQANIMVKDNRVRDFDAASEQERRLLVAMTWGSYVAEVPGALAKLGFPFAKGELHLPTPPLSFRVRPARPITFSIVIPTHNRLSLVADALTTIMRQSYEKWECVVFDNASEEPVGEHVRALGDDRIEYFRSEVFLPVTESWNRAIDHAKGEYVLLIGDDDGLVPHALGRLAQLIESFDKPDLIYSSFFQFFHPGVAPWEPSGSVVELRSGFFFTERTEEFLLDKESATLAVSGSLALRRSFAFNMQGQFFERRFLDRIRKDGKVFHSPFPDYYIANVAFAEADRILVSPRPLTIAGVSRKSFGFTLFNKLPEKGESLLNNSLPDDPFYSQIQDQLLPGLPYHTSYLLTMQHVADTLKDRIATPVRIDRYRRIQIFHALGEQDGLLEGGENITRFRVDFLPRLTDDERDWAEWLIKTAERALGGDVKAARDLETAKNTTAMYASSTDALWARSLWVGEFATLPELFDRLEEVRTTH